MTQGSDLGREGELFAADYLKRLGYRIVARNYKIRHDELDIITVAPDKTLVFVEVKTVNDPGALGVRAEEHMTSEKYRRFSRVASLYAGSHQELVNDAIGWRLDLIAITACGDSFVLKHYENI
jgi:putative endonuclease